MNLQSSNIHRRVLAREATRLIGGVASPRATPASLILACSAFGRTLTSGRQQCTEPTSTASAQVRCRQRSEARDAGHTVLGPRAWGWR